MGERPGESFGAWLLGLLMTEPDGLSRRELARRMAELADGNAESQRRTLNRILSGHTEPRASTKALILAAVYGDEA